ncbi:MAG: 3'(2'),5'-bisphosphate nucleotidase [Desulfobacterales bacterium]|nr:3'(2'),5'-bisphosphate nucleotidase [Desulfobacterales bacterium]
MKYADELAVGVEAVRKACRLCEKVQKRLTKTEAVKKQDRSPVTAADFGSQAVLSKILMEKFPDDPILGEEEAGLLRDNARLCDDVLALVRERVEMADARALLEILEAGGAETTNVDRFWTIDPIDGTKGFLRGGQYAIALALIVNGRPALGLLGLPNFPVKTSPCAEHPGADKGYIFYGMEGEGAHGIELNADAKAPIHVDAIEDAARARFCESVEKAHASHEVHEQISRGLGVQAPPCRIDSQAKYAAIARGDAAIYLRMARGADYREKIWDHAAGVVLVQEAGGRVTDFSGNPLDFTTGRTLANNIGVLATNGRLHEKTLAAVSEVLSARK